MKDLNAQIKERKFARVYLLYGEESYLRNYYAKALMKAVTQEDTMNCAVFSENDIDLSAFRDFTETLPFFAEYRFALVQDSGLFARSAEDWAECIANLPETTVVVFNEEKADKRTKLFKAVEKVGRAVEMKKPGEDELLNWVVARCKANGLKITRSAAEEFVMRTSDNMENMISEFEKLASYVDETKEIRIEDVQAVTTLWIQNRIFQMMDAMAEGREKSALSMYYDLLALKEPPMRILFMVGKLIRQLLQTKELQRLGMNADAIAKQLAVRPFVAKKLLGQARRFTEDQLATYAKTCIEMEHAVKKGDLADKLGAELAFVKIARRG